MTSKKLALLSGVSCIAVLATYAWAASHEAKEVKVEEAAAKVEESAEPAPLCIPMAEAADATAATSETTEASSDETKEEAKTEESAEAVKTEDVAAEVALPVCDEEGNPPAPEGDAEASDATGEAMPEKAAEEPAKTE